MSNSTWIVVVGGLAVLVLAGLLVWFVRRSRGRDLRHTGDRALAHVIRVEATEAGAATQAGAATVAGDVRCAIAFRLESLTGGRTFDRQTTLSLPQQRVPRVGNVWPAWYRSTDPRAFEVEVPDPGNSEQVWLFREFGLRHPAQPPPAPTGAAHDNQRPGEPLEGGPPAPGTATSAPGALPPPRTGDPPGPPTAAQSPVLVSRPAAPRPAAGAPSARSAAGSRAPQDDPVIELERLIRLHDNGSITDEEFTAAKAKYLRS